MKKPKGNLIFLKKINISLIIFFIFFISIFILFEIWANSHFINVFLAGENINFFNFAKAKKLFLNEVDVYLSQDFRFKIKDQEILSKLKDIGLNINVEQTLVDILKKQNFSEKFYFNFINQIKSFFVPKYYDLMVSLDFNKFNKFIDEKLNVFIDQPQNAFVEKINGEFILHKSKDGSKIDTESLKKEVISASAKLQNKEFDVKTLKTKPNIEDFEAQKAIDDALALVSKKNFKLKYKDETWPVPKEVIYDIISFKIEESSINILPSTEEIENFLNQIAPQIAKKPENAILSFNDNKNVVIRQKDISGREIEIQKTLNEFVKSFNERNEIIEIKIREIPAALREDNYLELGINSLLAQGKTNFSGSAASRVHNIKVGAAKFNGILIAPQEEFSFNKNLGEISPEQGYLPGLVIKDNKTIPEYGGGLCQVSTTLFQAVVKAGLKITERSPHAYPVAFYNPPGFDATIYSPYTDLKFVNITNGYIYIQSEIKGNDIIFSVFGLNEGRQIKLKGPIIYETKNDGSMKTVLTQEVYDKDNNLLLKKSFYSNYKSPSLYPILRNPLE